MTVIKCPVCEGQANMLDVMDLNKSCGQAGEFFPLSGKPIYYFHCENCAFTFAPEFKDWSQDDFLKYIYNEKYIEVDPNYVEARPQGNFQVISELFNAQKNDIKHLDYGGGSGRLSELLKAEGWNSQTYDPFSKTDTNLKNLGKFNLITAFEVFEHVSDVNQLMSNLVELMDNTCLILFSTLLSDGNIHLNNRITWWYAAPRNGHISLFSRKSLTLLGEKNKLQFGSFNDGFHCYLNAIPDWARHFIR